jgi:hypothetical protein
LADWVFAENLRPFLLSLGWFVGYDLDEDDWTAIRSGIETTDQEAELTAGSTMSSRANNGPLSGLRVIPVVRSFTSEPKFLRQSSRAGSAGRTMAIA